MTRPLGLIGLAMAVFVSGLCAHGAEQDKNKRVTLSKHETVAEFQGTKEHKCMGRTSLCPDKCGQSGTLAVFKIIKYISYEKPGEYGDPKAEQFVFLIEDNMKNAKVPANIRDIVNTLKKGDQVLLSWNHDYVTVDRSSSPERIVTKLEKIDGPAKDQPVKKD